MNDQYVTQTETGRIYGVSSRTVGRWLKDIGLRSPCGTPTIRAFKEGFADGRPWSAPLNLIHVL